MPDQLVAIPVEYTVENLPVLPRKVQESVVLEERKQIQAKVDAAEWHAKQIQAGISVDVMESKKKMSDSMRGAHEQIANLNTHAMRILTEDGLAAREGGTDEGALSKGIEITDRVMTMNLKFLKVLDQLATIPGEKGATFVDKQMNVGVMNAAPNKVEDEDPREAYKRFMKEGKR